MDSVERYEPERQRRYPVELEPAGSLFFDRLNFDAQQDVAQCVGNRLGVPDFDVKKRLKGTEIPVYFIDPSVLIGDDGRFVRTYDVERYAELLTEDIAQMPPVIIDSEAIEYPLCEGGHRTVAAIRAGIPQIYAVDVAKAYIFSDEIRFRK